MHAVDSHGIGLVLHPTRDPGPAADTIVAWARERDTEVLVRHEDVHRCPPGVQPVPEEELAARAQALLSIGGDGTMLGALRLVVGRDVPVLGVNLGKLGFLIEVEPDELDDALDRLELGDGVVIATPMGSTAYSYASGGPVVSPGLDAVVVTPTASMFGISRPLVVSTAEPIHLSLVPDSGTAALEIDGALVERIGPGAVVDVRLQPSAGLIVRFDHERHQQRTRVKLSLLDLPYLPDELQELSAGQEALRER
jgi:NAD+ kinase